MPCRLSKQLSAEPSGQARLYMNLYQLMMPRCHAISRCYLFSTWTMTSTHQEHCYRSLCQNIHGSTEQSHNRHPMPDQTTCPTLPSLNKQVTSIAARIRHSHPPEPGLQACSSLAHRSYNMHGGICQNDHAWLSSPINGPRQPCPTWLRGWTGDSSHWSAYAVTAASAVAAFQSW